MGRKLKTVFIATAKWRWSYKLVSALTIVFGLYFLSGGGYLLVLGGSPYFVVAGITMLVAGVLLWSGRHHGGLLYGLAVASSAVWAVADAGWAFWPLFSRL